MTQVVVLHGWGTSARIFEPLAARLTSRCAMDARDLPGYGRSRIAQEFDLTSVAEALAVSSPVRCSVVGWSLGALVAMTWARAQPEQVARLVLISATPCFVEREDWSCAMERRAFEDFVQHLEADADGTLKRFCALQAQGDRAQRAVTQQLRKSLACERAADLPVLRSSLAVLGDADLRPILHEIAQPTLLLHGQSDGLVPLAAGEYLQRNLPRAKLHVIEAAAHAPFLSEPDLVASQMRDFLQ